MFAPNILVVENKRVVLGEVCRNLSVAFAEVRPPFILFCPVFILLSSSFHLFLSFSLLFSLSFFLLHARILYKHCIRLNNRKGSFEFVRNV